MKPAHLATSALVLSLAVTGGAYAATAPDAGRTLQELRTAPALPAPSAVPVLEKTAPTTRKPGGARVTLRSIGITGNTVFPEHTLLEVIKDAPGQSYDLAGLKTLADRISAFYHGKNYPFARAIIPAQPMKNGHLTIEVVEGRYGTIKIDGADRHAATAQQFLSGLHRGDVIDGKALERTTLILDDQPGYSFVPVIRPGADLGTGDLSVRMTPTKRYGGSVSADTFGNRYTGRIRGLASGYVESPFSFGDRLSVSSIYTQADMWYGSANYSGPLGTNGLRGNVGYTQTYYELGKDFKSLDAHGTAKIASTGLTYPIVRTQAANLSLAATYQHKWLKDVQGVAGTDDKKTSDVIPVGLNFDARDTLGGGGITYGNVTWTHGILDLDSNLRATDMTTARTNGPFDKLNIDVARVQATPVKNLTVFGRVAGQMAGDNLDSSEDFGLGGPNGVRAYPSGEGYGDEGALAQLEVRYAMDAVTPYAFYDYGHIRTNHDTWAPGKNRRTIGGGGVGVRVAHKGWNADASAAWRNVGGNPTSDSRDEVPQLWLTVGYTF